MSRIAGLLVASLVLALAAPLANAADYNGRKSYRGANGSRGVEVVSGDCHKQVTETVRYREQVCRHGVAGYAYCRWESREHDVRVPETCGPDITTEGTTPARRGAFPPFPNG